MKQPQGMLSVLKDKTAPEEARDDAAMDLHEFDEPAVEAALLAVASDEDESELVAGSAGESLADIWARKGRVPEGAWASLQPIARSEAMAILELRVPSILPAAKDEEAALP